MVNVHEAASARVGEHGKSPKTQVLEALEQFATALSDAERLLPNHPEEQVRACLQMMGLGLQEIRHAIENHWVGE